MSNAVRPLQGPRSRLLLKQMTCGQAVEIWSRLFPRCHNIRQLTLAKVLHFAKYNVNFRIGPGAYLERCVAGIGEVLTANACINWNLAKLDSAI